MPDVSITLENIIFIALPFVYFTIKKKLIPNLCSTVVEREKHFYSFLLGKKAKNIREKVLSTRSRLTVLKEPFFIFFAFALN